MWSFFRGCGQLVDGALLESNKNKELNYIFGHHPCLLQPLWRGAFFYLLYFIKNMLNKEITIFLAILFLF